MGKANRSYIVISANTRERKGSVVRRKPKRLLHLKRRTNSITLERVEFLPFGQVFKTVVRLSDHPVAEVVGYDVRGLLVAIDVSAFQLLFFPLLTSQ